MCTFKEILQIFLHCIPYKKSQSALPLFTCHIDILPASCRNECLVTRHVTTEYPIDILHPRSRAPRLRQYLTISNCLLDFKSQFNSRDCPRVNIKIR